MEAISKLAPPEAGECGHQPIKEDPAWHPQHLIQKDQEELKMELIRISELSKG